MSAKLTQPIHSEDQFGKKIDRCATDTIVKAGELIIVNRFLLHNLCDGLKLFWFLICKIITVFIKKVEIDVYILFLQEVVWSSALYYHCCSSSAVVFQSMLAPVLALALVIEIVNWH